MGRSKETPPADDALNVPVDDIAVPPEAVAEAMLDDAGTGANAAPKREVATLDFVEDKDLVRSFPVLREFRLDGEPVKRISGRRLSISEAGAVVDANKDFDRYDFYAEMTGLPAPVLRGLDLEDGEALHETFHDFLPRFYREASASRSTSETGEASP